MPNSTGKIDPQLLMRIQSDPEALHRIAIVVNIAKTPLGAAFARVNALVKQVLENSGRTEQHVLSTGDDMHPYVTARLQGKVISALVQLDESQAAQRFESLSFTDAKLNPLDADQLTDKYGYGALRSFNTYQAK